MMLVLPKSHDAPLFFFAACTELEYSTGGSKQINHMMLIVLTSHDASFLSFAARTAVEYRSDASKQTMMSLLV
jgi:hypothetical protein